MAVSYYCTITDEVIGLLSEINVHLNVKHFPQFLRAQRYMVMLHSGQALFVPRRWLS